MPIASPSFLLFFVFLLPRCPCFRLDARKAFQARADACVQTRKAAEGEPTVERDAPAAAAPEPSWAEATVEGQDPKKPTSKQLQGITWCLEQDREFKAIGESLKNTWHTNWAGTFAAVDNLLKSLRGDFWEPGDDRKQRWNDRWTGILKAINRFIHTLIRRERRTQRRTRQLQKELEWGISNDVKELRMQLEASSTMLQSGSWKTLAELGFKLETVQELNKFQEARQQQGECVEERQEFQKLQEADAGKFKKLKERLSECMGAPDKVAWKLGSLHNLLEEFEADK